MYTTFEHSSPTANAPVGYSSLNSYHQRHTASYSWGASSPSNTAISPRNVSPRILRPVTVTSLAHESRASPVRQSHGVNDANRASPVRRSPSSSTPLRKVPSVTRVTTSLGREIFIEDTRSSPIHAVQPLSGECHLQRSVAQRVHRSENTQNIPQVSFQRSSVSPGRVVVRHLSPSVRYRRSSPSEEKANAVPGGGAVVPQNHADNQSQLFERLKDDIHTLKGQNANLQEQHQKALQEIAQWQLKFKESEERQKLLEKKCVEASTNEQLIRAQHQSTSDDCKAKDLVVEQMTRLLREKEEHCMYLTSQIRELELINSGRRTPVPPPTLPELPINDPEASPHSPSSDKTVTTYSTRHPSRPDYRPCDVDAKEVALHIEECRKRFGEAVMSWDELRLSDVRFTRGWARVCFDDDSTEVAVFEPIELNLEYLSVPRAEDEEEEKFELSGPLLAKFKSKNKAFSARVERAREMRAQQAEGIPK